MFPEKLLELLNAVYKHPKVSVRVDLDRSEPLECVNGLRQEC